MLKASSRLLAQLTLVSDLVLIACCWLTAYDLRFYLAGPFPLTLGPVWARPDDDRRTPAGAFLRCWSLDELPQLFNVLKGEMSLVGPRPERPYFVEEFRRKVPGYMLRHKVKAGMTEWAQINGWRGNTSLEKRIEYDLYYIERWSLAFDLKILIQTLWRGFVSKNAY